MTTLGLLSFSWTRGGTPWGVAPSTDRTGEAGGAGVDDNPCFVDLGVLKGVQ